MNKYLIEGRLWFDKINGNTYHAVTITQVHPELGKIVYQSPHKEYGYGHEYEQTAYDVLVKMRKVKEVDRFDHNKNRKRFIYRKKHVLKRELIVPIWRTKK